MRLLMIFLLSLLGFISQVSADASFTNRKDVQFFINTTVRTHGFNKTALIAVMDQVQLQPKIIESMNRPYEKKTWDVYKKLFLTDQRLNEGLQFWHQNEKMLNQAEKQYGVPAEIIVAILGVETLYGKNQGNYRVLDALATLAFNYPSRSVFFTKELTEYLLLCREHHVSPTQYLGSYAGAMGKPQFMPSSYRFYAIDFNQKGRRDLMNDNADVIASVANYFHKHGWHLNEAIAEPASISGNHYKSINTNFKQAQYFVKDLTTIGIRGNGSPVQRPSKAGLIELVNEKNREYWITYPNFYVITRYNTSPQYAMAVQLLAKQLRDHYVQSNHWRTH